MIASKYNLHRDDLSDLQHSRILQIQRIVRIQVKKEFVEK